MFEIANPKDRKLSNFAFRESIYEYLSGQLDRSRRIGFEAHLKANPDGLKEMETIRRALDYCERLSQTTLGDKVAQEVRQHREPADLFWSLADWRKWPDPVKWTLEAGAGALVIIILAVALPWASWIRQFRSDKITLARGRAPISQSIEEKMIPIAEHPLETQTPQAVSPLGDSLESTPRESAVVSQEIKPEKTVNRPEPKPEPPKEKQTSEKLTATAPRVEMETSLSGKNFKGVLYRLEISTPNLDTLTPVLVERLTALGAERAGQVELGFRQSKESYFHFSLPESSLEPFLNELKTHGNYTMAKEAHRRVMPEGIVRLILRVKMQPDSSEPNSPPVSP